MSDRTKLQLAIGYGLGAGMIIGGIMTIGFWSLQNYLGINLGIYIIGGIVIVGGIAIAVYNALKLNNIPGDADTDP